MKNYAYGWQLKDMGFIELEEKYYTEHMLDTKSYIDMLSNVVVQANCGWDSVEYKVMNYHSGDSIREYMVLCVDGRGERYIPISGNSKACNLAVLGENLW